MEKGPSSETKNFPYMQPTSSLVKQPISSEGQSEDMGGQGLLRNLHQEQGMCV